MTYIYDESGKLKCGNCGSYAFDLVIEQHISNVTKDGKDPVANRTIESENIVSLLCSKCGARIK